MQTSFTLAQLADPDVAESEKILRACVHCGFCTATCPTYVLDGNELDSPRGRIYLIKDMLENDRPATAEVALHIDRCLSCLACMTTCPSGVHYMHLVDHARAHIEHTYRRPLAERLLRTDARQADALSAALPARARRGAARQAVRAACRGDRAQAACRHAAPCAVARPAPARSPRRLSRPWGRARGAAWRCSPAASTTCWRRKSTPPRSACSRATASKWSWPKGAGCCGSLVHHMGREDEALAQARANIDAWTAIEGLDAIVITTSGCGTTVKDYGFMLRTDPAYAERAAKVAGLAQGYQRISRRLCRSSRTRTPPDSSSPITRPARCSTGSASRGSRRTCSPSSASSSRTCRTAICAAARPAPTIFCSRISQEGCASAKSGLSRDCDLM